jgi:hypothetical protein
VIVIVGPGDSDGVGSGVLEGAVAVGSGLGLGVAVWVTVTVPGGAVDGVPAGVVKAGAGGEVDPGETAGGGVTVLAGTLVDGRAYDEAGVRYGTEVAVRVGSAGVMPVDAAGLNTTGCGAGDGLGVTGSPRVAITVVTRPDSAMVIVAAMIVTAQAASSATQATLRQGMSRRTIRGCLPSQRLPLASWWTSGS